jgi:hypothetical protein
MSEYPSTNPPHEETAALKTELEHLRKRIADLETKLETKDDRIDELERDRDRLEETTKNLEDRLEECEHNQTEQENAVDAALNKAGANKNRIEELQSRELEKGAHLRTDTVDEHELEVRHDYLERVTRDDGGTYYRLPESADPLDDGSVSLAYGDLLPIQQLARMDETALQSTANALPTRLAAKLWKARTDSSVSDDPWRTGCKGIEASVRASDLKHWIRRQESGISETYAKSSSRGRSTRSSTSRATGSPSASGPSERTASSTPNGGSSSRPMRRSQVNRWTNPPQTSKHRRQLMSAADRG